MKLSEQQEFIQELQRELQSNARNRHALKLLSVASSLDRLAKLEAKLAQPKSDELKASVVNMLDERSRVPWTHEEAYGFLFKSWGRPYFDSLISLTEWKEPPPTGDSEVKNA